MNPFRMMLEARMIHRTATLAQLSRAYRCTRCKGRETAGGLLQPSYQYMGSPADTAADSLVNRLLRTT